MEDNVRKLSTIAVCSITAATTLFAVGTTAWSANFDNMFKTANANWDCRDGERDNGLFCRTDNAEMTIVREPGMTSQGDKDIVTTLRNEYSPTDLKVYIESEGVYNGDTETDIVYDYHEYGGNIKGVTWCNDAVSDTKCDQHYVEFDDTDPTMNEICHETGHAVGLTHGAQASPPQDQRAAVLGCMRAYANSSYRDLGSHNTSMINGAY
ncbi:hypothetical protein [Streptomyces avermitilis]|uniref:Peptidase M10 metallopeptidase domain-containing protein n=2 Tax=Streptomyces avermitilis TaxID=33903 RepID=A0A143SZ49_STRAW|nr:hypothetical protein [Streptomyces avermitilis]BAU77455.1 hypothetical protein SAVERM_2p011 [Streptomyces avermitilis MA-4680 = NBRC 14893]BBJ56333.1 hypothetical protein SAVMC3_89620 [Streptomyces avermitilis]GDY70125.1 hypothetical protein SAV14893_095180 [Streptomyces avermitilis]GDY80417.1 hypothetical protein SAV31267_099020 [Streptomyces avermitilis]